MSPDYLQFLYVHTENKAGEFSDWLNLYLDDLRDGYPHITEERHDFALQLIQAVVPSKWEHKVTVMLQQTIGCYEQRLRDRLEEKHAYAARIRQWADPPPKSEVVDTSPIRVNFSDHVEDETKHVYHIEPSLPEPHADTSNIPIVEHDGLGGRICDMALDDDHMRWSFRLNLLAARTVMREHFNNFPAIHWYTGFNH